MWWWIRLIISVALAGIGIAISVLVSRSLTSVDRFTLINRTEQWTLQPFPECVFMGGIVWDHAELDPKNYGKPLPGDLVIRHDVNQREPARWFREYGFVQASTHQHGFLGIRFDRMRYADRVYVGLAVPTWYIIAITVAPLAWMMWRMRFCRRRPPGLCPHCGYDLRATPARCPECGRVPAK
jgi:hypothetical protein